VRDENLQAYGKEEDQMLSHNLGKRSIRLYRSIHRRRHPPPPTPSMALNSTPPVQISQSTASHTCIWH